MKVGWMSDVVDSTGVKRLISTLLSTWVIIIKNFHLETSNYNRSSVTGREKDQAACSGIYPGFFKGGFYECSIKIL